MSKAEDDRFWASIVKQAQRAAGFAPTQAELERDYAAAEPVPMTKDEIDRIVRYVIERSAEEKTE